MKRVVLASVLCLLPAAVWPHDDAEWIMRERLHDPQTNAWCCGEHDCERQPGGSVTEVDGGFLVVATGEVIAYARVIWKSPTGEWWRCRFTGGERAGQTRCLIGPPRGT
jgi:hypothetical protein